MRLLMGLARRSSDPVEDLIQVGSIGLLEAIDRYETGHNTEFKTYAVHYITGHIRHYLRDKQNLMRGPRVLQELSYRLNKITKDMNLLYLAISSAFRATQARIKKMLDDKSTTLLTAPMGTFWMSDCTGQEKEPTLSRI